MPPGDRINLKHRQKNIILESLIDLIVWNTRFVTRNRIDQVEC